MSCFGRDVLKQGWIVEFHLVAALLEGNAEYLLVLYRCWHKVGVYLDDIVRALALCLQNFYCLRSIVWSYHAIANLSFDEGGCGCIACVTQSNKVAVRTHTVGTACTCIGTSQW